MLLKHVNKSYSTKHYLIKSSEGFSLSFVVWVTLMTNGTTLLCCCHKTYFMDPILIHMRFHSHLFTLTKLLRILARMTILMCIWPLKHYKLCLFVYLDYLQLNLVLAARLGCDCECTEKLLWSAWVPKDVQIILFVTMQQWAIRQLTILSTVPKRELKSCIAAFSSRCADVKRRSKREDALQLNHSRCF